MIPVIAQNIIVKEESGREFSRPLSFLIGHIY